MTQEEIEQLRIDTESAQTIIESEHSLYENPEYPKLNSWVAAAIREVLKINKPDDFLIIDSEWLRDNGFTLVSQHNPFHYEHPFAPGVFVDCYDKELCLRSNSDTIVRELKRWQIRYLLKVFTPVKRCDD